MTTFPDFLANYFISKLYLNLKALNKGIDMLLNTDIVNYIYIKELITNTLFHFISTLNSFKNF